MSGCSGDGSSLRQKPVAKNPRVVIQKLRFPQDCHPAAGLLPASISCLVISSLATTFPCSVSRIGSSRTRKQRTQLPRPWANGLVHQEAKAVADGLAVGHHSDSTTTGRSAPARRICRMRAEHFVHDAFDDVLQVVKRNAHKSVTISGDAHHRLSRSGAHETPRRARPRAAAPSSATSSPCPRGTACTGRSFHACRSRRCG